MIANLRDYEPNIIEFVIPEAIRETFPRSYSRVRQMSMR